MDYLSKQVYKDVMIRANLLTALSILVVIIIYCIFLFFFKITPTIMAGSKRALKKVLIFMSQTIVLKYKNTATKIKIQLTNNLLNKNGQIIESIN